MEQTQENFAFRIFPYVLHRSSTRSRERPSEDGVAWNSLTRAVMSTRYTVELCEPAFNVRYTGWAVMGTPGAFIADKRTVTQSNQV